MAITKEQHDDDDDSLSPEELDQLAKELELEEKEKFIDALLAKATATLLEQCDSVRIVVTLNDGTGGFAMSSYGGGNFYAQRDSVREWLHRRDQETRNSVD